MKRPFVPLIALLFGSWSIVHAGTRWAWCRMGCFELEDNGTLAGWLPFDTVPDMVPNNVHGVPSGYFEFIWDTASDGGGKGSLLLRGRGIRLPAGPRCLRRSRRVVRRWLYVISPKHAP